MLELGLFWVGVAVVIVAWLMLFADAFKQNRAWGIAGLVLFIPLIVHIALAWSSLTVRKATYALIIGVLAILVSIAGGALAQLPFLTKHEVVQTLEENIAPPKDTPLPNEEQVQAITDPAEEGYDPLLSGSEFEEVDVEEIVPPSTPPVRTTAASRYVPIPAEDLPAIISKQVRLSMVNGDIVEGELTHVEEDSLTVESAVEGGILGLSYSVNNIKSVAVRLAPGESVPTLAPPAQEQIPATDLTPSEVPTNADDVESNVQETLSSQIQEKGDAVSGSVTDNVHETIETQAPNVDSVTTEAVESQVDNAVDEMENTAPSVEP